jgi:hypothetical protein
MIRLVEDALINEMAYPCRASDGYGMVIRINSNDHGVLDNRNSPAHADILSADMKTVLGHFVITSKAPQKPEDIQWYRTPKIPEGMNQNIFKWSKGKNKVGVNNWQYLVSSWLTTRPA